MHRYIFIFLIIYALFFVGGTYAYYVFQIEEESVITGNVIAIDVDLEVELVVGTNTKMVPLQDEALSNAINGVGSVNGACIDNVGNLSCQIYKITLTNNGSRLKNLEGTIELYPKESNNNSYTNLKWRELTNPTTVNSNSNIKRMSRSTLVSDLTMESKEVRVWYIAVWLSEVDYDQREIDKGKFGGTVTFEVEGTEYAVYSEEDKSLTFYKTTDTIEVGEKYNGKIVTKVYTGFESVSYSSTSLPPWSEYSSEITNVMFEHRVTPVSTEYWFYKFSACTSMDVKKLSTENVTVAGHMFEECSSLTTLDVSSFDTSNITNMRYMFQNCSSLTILDVSNFDTSNVISVVNMFYSSLTSLNLSNFDTSKVTHMAHMFSNCSSLMSLDLSSFDTSKVTNMAYMFYSCSSLININISNFDTSEVSDFRHLFDGCTKLTYVDVSNFDTSNALYMHNMFSNCSSLTNLYLSSFETSNVLNIHSMFSNCSSLISLDLSNFDTTNVTNMHYMFQNCSSLTSLNLSSFDTTNVTNMAYMFQNCSSLTSLDLSNFDTSKVTDMSGLFNGCVKLKTLITIRNTGTTTYTNMFLNAATNTGATITVNYTSDTSSLVDSMIVTKSTTSNVIKGSQV